MFFISMLPLRSRGDSSGGENEKTDDVIEDDDGVLEKEERIRANENLEEVEREKLDEELPENKDGSEIKISVSRVENLLLCHADVNDTSQDNFVICRMWGNITSSQVLQTENYCL